ncbi:GNAT family N-acetyltransferase [Corynebacterium lubricantis]|uniref:GNAT family N-acetyltransferase n=1 Tax=Corynebacterium lubricantis TaxID=541095 RepID=UPI00037D7C38|nr:GNAT family N-acetyltransferase [Corynebacterium lubricantis]
MFHTVVFARPTAGAGAAVSSAQIAEPSEALGQYAFSSTLAIQDITSDVTSGTSASRLAVRLAGSAESDAYLFALCTSPPGPRDIGAFGYPAVPSTGTSGDPLEVAAWVMISLPLLEDTRVIEAHVTIDASIAPLPGEPLDGDVTQAWEGALSLIDELSLRLERPIRQLWITHGASDLRGPELLEANGYRAAFTEIQAKVSLEPATLSPSVHIAYDMRFPAEHSASMASIYTDSSARLPRGELIMDTIAWSEQRILDASGRLLAKGGEQITAYILREGTVVAFSEVMRFSGAEDTVIELGATFVLEAFRNQGLGKAVMFSALAEARSRWPKARTGYTSYPDTVKSIAHLNQELGEDIISATTAWQRVD